MSLQSKKEYLKEYWKEYRLKNRERLKERHKGWYLKNKERHNERTKENYLKNREKRIKQMAEYNFKNREHLLEQMKEHHLKNKEKKREYNREYMRKRYNTDINFRLKTLCRIRVRLALKGFDKSASTMELIGCTPDELRKHIESLFQPWMTWENQGAGGWDIDHIKACFHFNLADPEQQRACFNWSNLQPLEHIANIKKGAG